MRIVMKKNNYFYLFLVLLISGSKLIAMKTPANSSNNLSQSSNAESYQTLQATSSYEQLEDALLSKRFSSKEQTQTTAGTQHALIEVPYEDVDPEEWTPEQLQAWQESCARKAKSLQDLVESERKHFESVKKELDKQNPPLSPRTKKIEEIIGFLNQYKTAQDKKDKDMALIYAQCGIIELQTID